MLVIFQKKPKIAPDLQKPSKTTIVEVADKIIDEMMYVPPVQLPGSTFDLLMQDGWRLLGGVFVRHNHTKWLGQPCQTIPLRIRLANFTISKSQRKVLQRNADLKVTFGPITINDQKKLLFLLHTERFSENIPPEIECFINERSDVLPVPGGEFSVYEGDTLIACSYIHVGDKCVNGTYCFYDPAYGHRSLGTFTFLLELFYGIENGFQFYYQGYTYNIPSGMDYKKGFHGVEKMDWANSKWSYMARVI
jgi:arginine-tRNA-protein transferase